MNFDHDAGPTLSVVAALGRFLDRYELRLEHRDEAHAGPPRIRFSGIDALDRVLGGGIRNGRVTILDCELRSQGRAMLHTVARRAPHRVLFVVNDTDQALRDLIAGASGIPGEVIRIDALSGDDWEKLNNGFKTVRDRDLFFSAAVTERSIRRDIDEVHPDLVVILDPTRIATNPGAALDICDLIARRTNVALLTALSTSIVDGHRRIPGDRVVVEPAQLGGRATMLSTASPQGLSAENLTFSLLTCDVH